MKTKLLRRPALFAAAMLSSSSLPSAATVLNFDDLPAMGNFVGTTIPQYAQLSTLYRFTYGVTFSSGAPYVAVVDLGFGHATEPISFPGLASKACG
jgi:hypothetical protein